MVAQRAMVAGRLHRLLGDSVDSGPVTGSIWQNCMRLVLLNGVSLGKNPWMLCRIDLFCVAGLRSAKAVAFSNPGPKLLAGWLNACIE